MTNKLSGLSYIVPVYNEAESIVDTLNRLIPSLSVLEIPYEVIVVNDGSTDDSNSRLASIEDDHLTIYRHPINAGYGAAIKTGLLASKYDWIGLVDSDGSYEIEAIPRLIEKAEYGFDMVIGCRGNVSERDRFVKAIFRRILRRVVLMLVDKNIKDLNSGFRIVRKSAVMEFFPFLCGTFSFTTSLTILFLERGLFVGEVDTKYSLRKGKSKVRHFRDSLRAAQMILQGVSYFNPIKIFVFISLLMIIFICVPAMVVAMFGMATLSAYLFIFGVAVTLLIGFGIIGDIVRVSAVRAESIGLRLPDREDESQRESKERRNG